MIIDIQLYNIITIIIIIIIITMHHHKENQIHIERQLCFSSDQQRCLGLFPLSPRTAKVVLRVDLSSNQSKLGRFPGHQSCPCGRLHPHLHGFPVLLTGAKHLSTISGLIQGFQGLLNIGTLGLAKIVGRKSRHPVLHKGIPDLLAVVQIT